MHFSLPVQPKQSNAVICTIYRPVFDTVRHTHACTRAVQIFDMPSKETKKKHIRKLDLVNPTTLMVPVKPLSTQHEGRCVRCRKIHESLLISQSYPVDIDQHNQNSASLQLIIKPVVYLSL